ncbi:hypothetical protein IFM89_010375 [Coptis chinensis]|uniref:Equilibrative nucleotide transporter 8 n=1 Tax=Coptis chinensis TaxID=261450 RepID=A0A835IVB7_9MAGN|nr:hypothetical protein IFM89_010375 [Coptis chinensis]
MEEGKGPNINQNEPRDTYNIAYIIHLLLGAGNLLPWNVLITAVDYFGYLYPSRHIDKVFSVAYMTSSLPVLVLIMSWGRWFKVPSFRLRMNLGLAMFVFSLMTPPLLDWTSRHNPDPKWRPDGVYNVVVAGVVICGLADGLVAGSLIGSTGLLPKRYMQAVFAGTASSGVLVSILRIITKASLPQNTQGLRTSAHIYFAVSILIMVGCIVCCNILERLPVMQHYRAKSAPIVPANHHTTNHYSNNQQNSASSLYNVNYPFGKPKIWNVGKKILWPAMGIFIIYVVTLSIFPGYISENVESKALGDWYPILLITLYNFTDLLGKSFTAVYVPKSSTIASSSCIARLLFYPLFTACLHGPRWLRSTEYPVAFLTGLLGLTNGYLTSALMILAPKLVPVSEAETAGIVMVLSLGIGLVGGSVLGWLWMI